MSGAGAELMNSELILRAYQPGDERHILELFRQTYQRDLSESIWAWRFRDCPTGPGIIDLAWDGNQLAAHYGVTPVAMRVNGQDCLTGLSGTTMTHPDYRGRGLFTSLAQRVYARMAESGMTMVWGFPNLQSHRGFIRDLAWKDIYEVPTLHLRLPTNLSPVNSGHVIELPEFDSRFDQLWNKVKDECFIIGRRDRQYLHWRYRKNPEQHYRILVYQEGTTIAGYIVFKRYQSELQIVDILLGRDVEVGEELVAETARIALEDSAASIGLWLNVTHPLHHTLEKMGFRLNEPITYWSGLVLQSNQTDVPLYDFRKWHLTMGDSDVF